MSQEFDSLEDAIEKAEEKAEERRRELSEAEAKGLGFSELAELYKAIEEAEADVETKTDRWDWAGGYMDAVCKNTLFSSFINICQCPSLVRTWCLATHFCVIASSYSRTRLLVVRRQHHSHREIAHSTSPHSRDAGFLSSPRKKS